MHEKVGKPALDRFEVAKPRVGRVEPLHQSGDAIFKMRKRRVVGVGKLDPVELFDQPAEQLFQIARHGLSSLARRGQRGDERINALLKRRNVVTAPRRGRQRGGKRIDTLLKRRNVATASSRRSQCGGKRIDTLLKRRNIATASSRRSQCGGKRIDTLLKRRNIATASSRRSQCGGKRIDTLFKTRHVVAGAARRGQRRRQRVDALLQRRNRVAGRRGVGDDVDLAGERANLFGEARQRIIGCDVRNDPAQAADRRL